MIKRGCHERGEEIRGREREGLVPAITSSVEIRALVSSGTYSGDNS